MIPLLKDILSKNGYSLTKPRLTVFSALQGTKPKTMRELVDSLSDVIDRASVYRTVALYEKLGIITRIQHGWKYRIELSDNFTPHHHHLTCNDCHKVISFEEPDNFEAMIKTISVNNNFSATNHNLEIYGQCMACKTLAASHRV